MTEPIQIINISLNLAVLGLVFRTAYTLGMWKKGIEDAIKELKDASQQVHQRVFRLEDNHIGKGYKP